MPPPGHDKPCVGDLPRHARRRRRPRLGDRDRRSTGAPSPSTRCPRTPSAPWPPRPATASGGPRTAARRSPRRASTAHRRGRRRARARRSTPRARRLDPRRGARAAAGLRHRRVGQASWCTSADEAVAAAERRGLPGRAQVDRPDAAAPGRASAASGSTCAPRRRCAPRGSRSPSGSRPLDADRFVVQKMATPGVPCVVTSRRGPAVRPGRRLQRRRAADRAARRHRATASRR